MKKVCEIFSLLLACIIMTSGQLYGNESSTKPGVRRSNAANTGSAYFGGRNMERIRVRDASPVNPSANPSAYAITGTHLTLEAWIYPIDTPPIGEADVIVLRPCANVLNGFTYGLCIGNPGPSNDSRIGFLICDGGVPGNYGGAGATSVVALGVWTHIAGTYDGTKVRLYLNGSLVSEMPYTASIGSGDTGFYVGGGLGVNYFSGLIDELRLWNVARSQAEIQANMNGTLAGSETGLAGYWPLDESTEVNGISPVTVDLTANHNDLNCQNGVQFVPATPGTEFTVAPEIVVQPLEAVVGSLFSYNPIVCGWPVPVVSLISGPSGLYYHTPSKTVQWTPAANQTGYRQFTLQAVNSKGTTQAMYTVWVDALARDMKQHDNNRTPFTVFNNGIIGANQGADAEGDVGFQFDGLNGLFEGDLIVAKSASQVSGALFTREFATQSAVFSIASGLPGFDQAFEARFNDSRAPNPIGISVVQRSYTKSSNPDRDYGILDYWIKNTSGGDLTDIFVGLDMDWDIGNANNNLGGYVAERKLGGMFESGGASNPHFYGVTALTGTVSGCSIWKNGSDEGDGSIYSRMTHFENQDPGVPYDRRMILSVGPYNIPARDSVRCAFGILAGTSPDDIRANADTSYSTFSSFNTGSMFLKNWKSQSAWVEDSNPVNPGANPSAYAISGNQITVESWIYPINLPGPGGSRIIVSRSYAGAPSRAYELRVYNPGPANDPRIEFVISDGTAPGNYGIARAPGAASAGAWTHVAGTYDGSAVRLYINGVLAAETAFTGNVGAGNLGFSIGNNNGGYFSGLIDEVRLWNAARDQASIQASMNSTLNGSEANLAGYWPLNESTTVNGVFPVTPDLTPNHNDLRVSGAQFTGVTPPDAFEALPEFVTSSFLIVADSTLMCQPRAYGWPVPTVSFVSGPAGMTFDGVTGTIQWTPAANQIGSHSFTLQAANSAGMVQWVYNVWVDSHPQDAKRHDNNRALMTVFNNGVIGADKGNNFNNGNIGFEYDGQAGLFEGDLVIAKSENQVSGVLFSREFATQGLVVPIAPVLNGFDQAFEARFHDGRATNPIGISVVQQSSSKSTGSDRDYVIFDYWIQNTSGGSLTGIYAGLAMDWDIGFANNNLGGYEAGQKLGYMFEAGGPSDPHFYGVAALNGTVSGCSIWKNGSEGNDASLYGRMTQFEDQDPGVPYDRRVVLSIGPYDIPAGERVRCTFAVLGGADLDELKANADTAAASFMQAQNWAVPLTVSGSNGTVLSCVFGGNPSGTDGFNNGLDVVSPPIPQTYYGYFEISPFPYYLSTDIRGWVWPYDADRDWNLKIVNAEGINTTIGWNPSSLPPQGSFTLTGAGNVNMRTNSSVSFSGNKTLVIQYGTTATADYVFAQAGWYMVSLPVIPADSSVSTLFPTALGGMAFGWDPTSGSYTPETKMKPKKGYWLAIPGAATSSVTGLPLNSYTEHFASQGWYMIGSVLGSVDFTNPNDNPAGSVLSPAFGWNSAGGMYDPATTLNEKQGYWIAVFNACDLTVGGSGGEASPAPLAKADWEAFYQKHGKTPPSPPTLDGKTIKAAEMPKAYGLSQNYPNPFNPETTIRYQIPDAGFVRLVIYNTMGQVVKKLVDKQQNAGYYEAVWNGKDERGLGMVSGMYMVRMEAEGFTAIRKVVLMK